MPPTSLAHKGDAVEEWIDIHFFRPVGLRVVRVLEPTRISADQVTVASLVIGLLAGHLFLYRNPVVNAAGLGLFIASDILDSADGQLARSRGSSTRFGRILDGISDNARFVNLYAHLLVRLLLAHAMAPLGAVALTLAAGVSHSLQAGVADFIRPGSYLERQVRRFTELWEINQTRDLPAVVEVAARLARHRIDSGTRMRITKPARAGDAPTRNVQRQASWVIGNA